MQPARAFPVQQVSYQGWTGAGWMVTDPATGEGAYLISGGLSGGSTVDRTMSVEYLLLSYASGCIDWLYVKSMYAAPFERDPSDDLPWAEYRAHLIENEAGAYVVKDYSSPGRFIKGERILVNRVSEVKLKNGQFREMTFYEILDTSSARFRNAGWYHYSMELSSIDRPNNPYQGHEEANPQLDLKLMAIVSSAWELEADPFKLLDANQTNTLPVAFIDKDGRDVERVYGAQGSESTACPIWKQEIPTEPELDFTVVSKREKHIYHKIEVVLPEQPLPCYTFSAAGFLDPNNELNPDPYTISVQYFKDISKFYSDYSNYTNKYFYEMKKVPYTDYVFDEEHNLNIDQVATAANELLGLPAITDVGIDTREEWEQLYDILVSNRTIPCIGVPAYAYQEGGVDMRYIMMEYVDAGCWPYLDRAYKKIWCWC